MDVPIIFLILLFVFGIPVVIAFLIYYYENVRKPLELTKMGKLEEYTKAERTIREKEIVVKEVVLIPCLYCKGLVPNTATYYPNCGAPQKISYPTTINHSPDAY